MAGFKIADAYVDVDADTDKVERGLAGIVGKGGIVGLGAKIGAGIVGGVVAFGVAQKVGSYLQSSVMGASDLNETINKSTVIFGKNAQAMTNWSENAAQDLGLSQGAALASAASFGDMFLQLGFTGDAAADMSKDVVQAAADLGSFSNLDTADVTERIAAAFRGEYDSLQAVIPNINAARVEQEALAATGKTVTSELTAQEKAAAVLAIVHADGARAMGDFANTSGGFANQMKIASAQSQDLKAKVGDALLPGLGAMAGVLTGQVMPALSLLADQYLPVVSGWMETLAGKISGTEWLTFNNGAVSAGPGLDGIISKVQPLIDLFVVLAPTIAALVGAFAPLRDVLINELVPHLSEFSVILAGALTQAITDLVPYIPMLASALTDTLTAVVPLIPQILELVPSLLELVPPLTELVVKLVPPLASLLGTVLPLAVTALSAIITGLIIPVLVWLVEQFGTLFDALTLAIELFSGDLGNNEFIGKITSMGGAMGEFIGWIVNAMISVSNFVNGAILGFKLFAAQVGANIAEAIAFITSLPDRALSALGNVGNLLYSAGADLIGGFIDGIKGMIGSVGDAVGGVLDFAASFFPHSPAERGPFSNVGGEWAALGRSGKAIGEQFASGYDEGDFAPPMSGITAPEGASSTPVGTTTTYNFEAGAFSVDMSKIKSVEDLLAMIETLTQVARAGRGKKA